MPDGDLLDHERRLVRLEARSIKQDRAIFGFQDDDKNVWVDGLMQNSVWTRNTAASTNRLVRWALYVAGATLLIVIAVASHSYGLLPLVAKIFGA